MLTILAFIFTLGVLITIHEYGHFQVARWCRVKVLRFSIGFGKPIFIRHFGTDRTEFVLAMLPLGGYVKMLDEREAPVENPIDLPRAFNRQPVWKRIAIVSAGPIANLLLAILLYWVLFMHGVMGLKPILGEIPQGSPAAEASLKSGELIEQVAGIPVATWQDVRWILLQQALRAPSVEIVAMNGNQETHLHQLSMAGIGKDDFEGDFLDKLGLILYQPKVPAKIGEIIEDSPAQYAGLKLGDEILSVNGSPISQWEQFVSYVRSSPGKPLTIEIQRADKQLSLQVTPDSVNDAGHFIGKVGAAYRMNQSELDLLLTEVKYGPVLALSKAAQKTWETSVFSLKMLASMLTGAVSWKGVSGPVTIASYAGQTAHIGWEAFIGFLALVSISLGVLNLLPVPVLDGGHLLYYTIEIFKGSPVSDRVMEAGQRVGIALLGCLMLIAFYNDFNRFITG